MLRISSLLVIGLSASIAFGQAGTGGKPDAKPGEPKSGDAAGPAKSAVKRMVVKPSPVAKLAWRFREVSYEDMPLQDVFAHIGNAVNVNIVVRWDRLAAVGIERDTAVSLNVKNLRLSQVLWLVFNQLDAASVKLAYRADRDMILISTAEDLGGSMVVKVYDIEDLVANRIARSEFRAERIHERVVGVVPNVAPGAVGVAPVTQDVGSGTYLWDEDVASDSDFEENNDAQEKARRIQQLIDVITASVEPDSWAANGGRGTILNFRGMLVVRNSPLVHQQLGGPMTDSDAP